MPFLFRTTRLGDSAEPAHCLYEDQISFAVVGIDKSIWTAYCFADTYYEDRESVDRYVSMNGTAHRVDPIAAGFLGADLPIWEPRKYFVRVVEIRMNLILREWQCIADKIEDEVKQYGTVHVSIPASNSEIYSRLILTFNQVRITHIPTIEL